jgi:hypothetical protein
VKINREGLALTGLFVLIALVTLVFTAGPALIMRMDDLKIGHW